MKNKKGNANGFLAILLIPILLFWLLLPTCLILFEVSGNNQNLVNDVNNIQVSKNPNAFTYLTWFFSNNTIGLFLKIIFFWVDGLPFIFNLLLWGFRITTVWIIAVVIRG